MFPNFLIIGAPRAGTTWIHQNIRLHPDIFMPSTKELHFFDRDFEKGLGFYEKYFEGVHNESAIGEASPNYLHTDGVDDRILNSLGRVRLIVSLRNPTDRLYSRYWNAKGKYKENAALSFEEKIAAKPEFIDEGLYYKHLQRFVRKFGRENIQILFFEKIKTAPESYLAELFRFLNVDSTFLAPLMDERINGADEKPLLAKSKLIYYVAKINKRLNLRKYSRILRDMNRADLPPMKQETREWLVNDVYKGSNEKLADLLQVDLSHWNQV